jgi:hypothetical protein
MPHRHGGREPAETVTDGATEGRAQEVPPVAPSHYKPRLRFSLECSAHPDTAALIALWLENNSELLIEIECEYMTPDGRNVARRETVYARARVSGPGAVS